MRVRRAGTTPCRSYALAADKGEHCETSSNKAGKRGRINLPQKQRQGLGGVHHLGA